MALLNYQNTTQDSTTNNNTARTDVGNAANSTNAVFNQGQQALQGTLSAFGNDIAKGDFSNFTQSPQLADYANMLFQRQIAPQIAGQYGVGSPQLGNRLVELNAAIASQQAVQAPQTAISAFNALSNYATRPIGETGTTTNQNTTNQNTVQNTNMTQNETGTDLSDLLSLLGLLPYLPGGGT